MLCCQEFEVKNYNFTLGRLAYESLRLVQALATMVQYKTHHEST